jgi:hypothetical protein
MGENGGAHKRRPCCESQRVRAASLTMIAESGQARSRSVTSALDRDPCAGVSNVPVVEAGHQRRAILTGDILGAALGRGPDRARANADLLVIGLAAACFVGAAALLSQLAGVPFTVPTEEESRALKVHYLVPLFVGLAGYGVLWAASRWLPGTRRRRGLSLAEVATDLYFLALFVVVMYVHFHVKMWMAVLAPALYDGAYLVVDRELHWLVRAMAELRRAIAQLVPGIDALYQMGFLLMFAVSFWFHALGERRYLRHYLVAVLLLEMLGAFAYLALPAVGPFIHDIGPNALATEAQRHMLAMFREAQAGGIEWLIDHGGNSVTSMPAAMPSLHVAGAIIMTYYAIRARLWITPLLVLVSAWIMLESVVTRWHYLVDLPAGAALAAVILLLVNRLYRSRDAAELRAAAAPAGGGMTIGARLR